MRFVTIFKAVTKNWLRSRAGLFFSIMFPILLLIVFGLIFGGIGSSSKYDLYVQNFDTNADNQPTQISTAFISALNSTDTFNIKMVPATENATDYARHNVGSFGGNIRILMIPQGFESDSVNATLKIRLEICYSTLNDSLTYYSPYMNSSEAAAVQEGLAQLQQFNASLPQTQASLIMQLDPSDQSGAAIQSIVASVADAFNYQMIGARNAITITSQDTQTQFKTIDYYIPAITAAFIMTNGIIGLTSTNTEFKRRGIIKRLSITPLTKMDWIIGCILSQTLLNLILTGIMIGVGWAVFNVRVIPDVWTLLMIFAGSVMFAGIGMTLSGLFKDVEAASAVGNAIAFPMMFLSGTYFPLEFMPSYLQTVSKALPLTYFSDGLKAAMITKLPDAIMINMAVVTLLAAVFIVLGARFTHWKEK
jgi:ABC-2 type transport system permease protein